MKIKSFKYERLYPIGSYLNLRLGIEMELSDTDTAEKAFAKAEEICDNLHKSKFPEMYNIEKVVDYKGEDAAPVKQPPKSNPDKKKDRIESLKQQISTCTELKVLESYALIAKNNPELQSTYDGMLEKLK